MKSKKIILSLCFFVSLFFLMSETASIKIVDIVPLLMENGVDFATAQNSLEDAQLGYELTKTIQTPTFSLELNPYSFSYLSSASSNNQYLADKSFTTHSTGLSLGMTQALPSGGSIGFSLQDTLSLSVLAEDKTYSQSPALSASFSQPLFLNNNFIDFNYAGLKLRLASGASLEASEAAYLADVNSSIIETLRLYVSVVSKQKAIDRGHENLAIASSLLEQDRIRQQQGQLSGSDLWGKELKFSNDSEAQQDLHFAILPEEQSLKFVLGLDAGIESLELDQLIPENLELPVDQELVERISTYSPGVVQALLAVEQSYLNRDLRSDYKPEVSFSVKISPEASPSETDKLGESFTNFFNNDLEYNLSGSLGLSIPLGVGRQRDLQASQDAIVIENAENTLETTRDGILNKYQLLSMQEDSLEDKVKMLENQQNYYNQRYQEALQYLELKLSTQLDVDQSRLALDTVKDSLWNAKAEIFINKLEILNLAGFNLAEILENL